MLGGDSRPGRGRGGWALTRPRAVERAWRPCLGKGSPELWFASAGAEKLGPSGACPGRASGRESEALLPSPPPPPPLGRGPPGLTTEPQRMRNWDEGWYRASPPHHCLLVEFEPWSGSVPRKRSCLRCRTQRVNSPLNSYALEVGPSLSYCSCPL